MKNVQVERDDGIVREKRVDKTIYDIKEFPGIETQTNYVGINLPDLYSQKPRKGRVIGKDKFNVPRGYGDTEAIGIWDRARIIYHLARRFFDNTYWSHVAERTNYLPEEAVEEVKEGVETQREMVDLYGGFRRHPLLRALRRKVSVKDVTRREVDCTPENLGHLEDKVELNIDSLDI